MQKPFQSNWRDALGHSVELTTQFLTFRSNNECSGSYFHFSWRINFDTKFYVIDGLSAYLHRRAHCILLFICDTVGLLRSSGKGYVVFGTPTTHPICLLRFLSFPSCQNFLSSFHPFLAIRPLSLSFLPFGNPEYVNVGWHKLSNFLSADRNCLLALPAY